MKAKDYRDQTIDELEATYEDICGEIFKLKNEAMLSKKVEKPHLIRHKRKDIARLLTVMNEKRQGEQKRS